MAESVKSFVNIVNKSLLGIFSLDLSKPLVLEIHSDKCDDLVAEIDKFIVK